MNGVGKEGDRSADEEDGELEEGGAKEDEEADLQGADTGAARLERVVDRIGGVVAVGNEESIEKPANAGGVRVTTRTVVMPSVMGMPVGMIVVMGVAVLLIVVSVLVLVVRGQRHDASASAEW